MNIFAYTLFLDESGKFQWEQQAAVPSAIMGYLCPGGIFTPDHASRVLSKIARSDSRYANIPVSPFHAMECQEESCPDFIVSVVENVVGQGARIVQFHNRDRLQIVNSDLTYLNLFAEGIVQLLQSLLRQNKDNSISLKIIFAHRRNMGLWEKEQRYGRIPIDWYEERIGERIELRMARLPKEIRLKCRWTLEMKDALQYEPLMIADAICFALRGGKRKFSDALMQRINQCVSEEYNFSSIEHSKWGMIQDYFIAGRYADAVCVWYIDEDKTLQFYKNAFETQIREVFCQSSALEQNNQLRAIGNSVDNLINQRKYYDANSLLDGLAREFIPLLNDAGISVHRFMFDIAFYRMTTASHQGDLIAGEEQRRICGAILPNFSARWETLDYYMQYKIREAEHLKNCFAFQAAINILDQLENILSETVGLFQLIEGLDSTGERLRSDTLGKILGSRLLARCVLMHQDPGHLAMARNESDAAIAEFDKEHDRSRQYQYRAQIEYEAGNFAEALCWLGKSFGLSADESSASAIINRITQQKYGVVFGAMHYARIMAGSIASGNFEWGAQLHSEWIKQDVEAKIGLHENEEYPVPLIHWKIASSFAGQKKKQTAERYYERSIALLESNPQRLTLRAIALAVRLERLALEPSARKMSRFLEKLKEFLAQPLPEPMRECFASWETELESAVIQSTEKQTKVCRNLARQVPVL